MPRALPPPLTIEEARRELARHARALVLLQRERPRAGRLVTETWVPPDHLWRLKYNIITAGHWGAKLALAASEAADLLHRAGAAEGAP